MGAARTFGRCCQSQRPSQIRPRTHPSPGSVLPLVSQSALQLQLWPQPLTARPPNIPSRHPEKIMGLMWRAPNPQATAPGSELPAWGFLLHQLLLLTNLCLLSNHQVGRDLMAPPQLPGDAPVPAKEDPS